MLDKTVGLAALAVLIGFMGILVAFVPDIDLVIVIAVVVALAAYDFYRSMFTSRGRRE